MTHRLVGALVGALAGATVLAAAACANGVGLDETLPLPDLHPAPKADQGDAAASMGGGGGDAGAGTHDAAGPGQNALEGGAGEAGVAADAASEPGDSGSSSGAKPSPGQLVISEVLYDPSGAEPDGEWVEVHNVTSSPLLLTGLTLRDGAQRTHKIGGSSLTIAPSQYAVLVRSKAGASSAHVPASAVVYEYGAGLLSTDGIQLANGSSGAVAILDGATEISSVPYGGWFTQSSTGGHSIQLKATAASTRAADWCLSAKAWASGADDGTPGAASDCP